MTFSPYDQQNSFTPPQLSVIECPKCEAYINLKMSAECPNCGFVYLPPGGFKEDVKEKAELSSTEEVVHESPPCPACGTDNSLEKVDRGIKCNMCKAGFIKVNGRWFKTMNI